MSDRTQQTEAWEKIVRPREKGSKYWSKVNWEGNGQRGSFLGYRVIWGAKGLQVGDLCGRGEGHRGGRIRFFRRYRERSYPL